MGAERPGDDPQGWAQRLLAGERAALARAITLVESHRPEDRERADRLLERLGPAPEPAVRVGLSGPPGVGKSTLIESLGMHLLEAGRRVAVLAVDPSSALSGGSILGDKARMNRLAQAEGAFIRPSPSANTLGGVTRRTRESIQLVEAAGYGVVLVETVGVGQSETAVAELVDTFVLLVQAGAGDELQAIKRGIVELADVFAITKADGDNLERAARARRDLESALAYLRPKRAGWTPAVVEVSGLEARGLADLWAAVEAHRRFLQSAGTLEALRREQLARGVESDAGERLLELLRTSPAAASARAELVEAVRAGELAPTAAARELLRRFLASDPAPGAASE